MEPEKINESPRESIKKFLKKHSGEVFESRTIFEKVDALDSHSNARYHLKVLVNNDEDFEREKHGQKYYYGCVEAVEKLREKLGR